MINLVGCSEEGLGDDAILSASIKLVSCLVAKLYLETEKDKRTVMIEEGLMIINQTKNLGRTSVDYDSVAKMYCALGDSAYIKGKKELFYTLSSANT